MSTKLANYNVLDDPDIITVADLEALGKGLTLAAIADALNQLTDLAGMDPQAVYDLLQGSIERTAGFQVGDWVRGALCPSDQPTTIVWAIQDIDSNGYLLLKRVRGLGEGLELGWEPPDNLVMHKKQGGLEL